MLTRSPLPAPSGRFPGIGDYGYVTMSRPCGGHHTVTQPIRRSARFQHLRHFYQAETEALPVHPAEIKLQVGRYRQLNSIMFI